MLQGTTASIAVRGLETLQSLHDAEFRVFSQFGEDGIIEWLVSKLTDIPPSFVEFGVEDYSEASSRFLLRHRNWRGLIMDGSAQNIETARNDPRFWENDLTAVQAFIDRDNINEIIRGNGFAGELGLLSIDIDGNDYWVWQSINAVRPWLVLIEYNATFGDRRPLVVPYDPLFERTRAHSSNLYWGSGIAALVRLGAELGYELLGTNLAGHNAFFARSDVARRFDSRILDKRPRPSLYRESRTPEGHLSYVTPMNRPELIGDMPLQDVETSQTLPLRSAGNLYSDEWLSLMGHRR